MKRWGPGRTKLRQSAVAAPAASPMHLLRISTAAGIWTGSITAAFVARKTKRKFSKAVTVKTPKYTAVGTSSLRFRLRNPVTQGINAIMPSKTRFQGNIRLE